MWYLTVSKGREFHQMAPAISCKYLNLIHRASACKWGAQDDPEFGCHLEAGGGLLCAWVFFITLTPARRERGSNMREEEAEAGFAAPW